MKNYVLCSIHAAKELFQGQEPFALLDVREQEEFSRGHLLLASCAPLSRIELLVDKLVPSKKIPVILMDFGDEGTASRAVRAAAVLQGMSFERVAILDGGLDKWRQAGNTVVTGVGALSKGFGEYVESRLETPSLAPEEVMHMMNSGKDLVVIDVRPREEYKNMHLPGAINAPGCEVTYRFFDMVPNPDTQVVISCAGRTRSIIGTQTLRNAGVPNPIAALRGGTMNWQLSGYTLEYSAQARTAPPSVRALEFAREKSAGVAQKYGVQFIGLETLESWQAASADTPLYMFDVRQPEEYMAGHIPGSRNAAGGQLVQATDEYAAVRNARFVLIDDTEVRAIMTAHWLLQMGIANVFVLRGGLGGSGFGRKGLGYGPEPAALPCFSCGKAKAIGAALLEKQCGTNDAPLIVNVGFSDRHRAGHIPGAVWVPRGYLERCHAAYPEAKQIVFTADNGPLAQLAANDAQALWPSASIYYLEGGTAGWTNLFLKLETGMPVKLGEEDDIWYRPYTDIKASPEAMRGYFNWEFGLVDAILKDGCVRFQLYHDKASVN